MFFSWNPSAFVWQKRNVKRNKTSIRKQQKHVLSAVQSRFKWKKKKKAFLIGTFIPNLPEEFLFLKFLLFKVLFDPRIIEKKIFFQKRISEVNWESYVHGSNSRVLLAEVCFNPSSSKLFILKCIKRDSESIKWLQFVSWFYHFHTTDSQPAVSLIYVINMF